MACDAVDPELETTIEHYPSFQVTPLTLIIATNSIIMWLLKNSVHCLLDGIKCVAFKDTRPAES